MYSFWITSCKRVKWAVAINRLHYGIRCDRPDETLHLGTTDFKRKQTYFGQIGIHRRVGLNQQWLGDVIEICQTRCGKSPVARCNFHTLPRLVTSGKSELSIRTTRVLERRKRNAAERLPFVKYLTAVFFSLRLFFFHNKESSATFCHNKKSRPTHRRNPMQRSFPSPPGCQLRPSRAWAGPSAQ